jgi:hypothetical protein
MGEIRRHTAAEGDDKDTQGRSAGLGRKLLGSLRNRRQPWDVQVLPQPARYAMTYRGARLSGEEIESLQRNGFPRAAFYLGVKGVEFDHRLQARMLQRLAALSFQYEELDTEDIRVATDAMKARSSSVDAGKLGQFSRHGPMGDVEVFDEVLSNDLSGQSDTLLFMVASYPYIALDVLAKYSLAKGNPLGIVNPDFLGQSELPVGFVMEGNPPSTTVSPIMDDYRMPPGAVIFDDVLREGKTMNIVMEWAGDDVAFMSAMRVRA